MLKNNWIILILLISSIKDFFDCTIMNRKYIKYYIKFPFIFVVNINFFAKDFQTENNKQ